MASRPRDKDQPDGAKPGSEALTGNERYAFDADGRAKAREDAIITLGERAFHRRRKNWQVTRELRALLREQEKAGNRGLRLRAQIDALTEEIRGVQDPDTGEWTRPPVTDQARVDDIETKVDALNDQIDQAGDDADLAAYKIVALLLRDDTDAPPDLDMLKDQADVTEIAELAATLAGGGETLEDPTPTRTSSDS